MGKRLFVLLIVAMVLVTVASIVLALTGHEDMVRAAFGWVAHSATSIIEALSVIAIVILLALFF